MRHRAALRNREAGVVTIEYAILVGFVAVALIPVLTAFTVAVNRYFERQTKNIEQAEVKIAKAQDQFIIYMDNRIAYLTCLANLRPADPASDCGAPPSQP